MARYIQTDLTGTIRCMVVGVGLLGGTLGSSTELDMGTYTRPSQVAVSGSPLSVDTRDTLTVTNDDLSISGTIQFTVTSTNTDAIGPWLYANVVGKNLTAVLSEHIQLTSGTATVTVDWDDNGGSAGEIGQLTVTATDHRPLRHRFYTTS